MTDVPGGVAQPSPGDAESGALNRDAGPGSTAEAAAQPGTPPPDFSADRIAEDAANAQDRRRYRSAPPLQWPLVIVLGGLLGSLLIVATDHFRRGSVLFAAFVVGAFFLRLILPDRDTGWLGVRSRGVDLVVLAFLGLGLSVFALIVPPPS